MARNTKEVYRPGDLVRIVNPEIFYRCGYPFDQKAEAAHIFKTHYARLIELINHLDPVGKQDQTTGVMSVCSALAYMVAARNDFSGNVRSVYTQRDDYLLGTKCVVYGKRTVKSGVRSVPYTDFEGEYNPPTLDDQRSHVILEVAPIYDPDNPKWYTVGTFEIEETNVERVFA